ncbi:MAG: VacJ family lipoprotein [Desulfococcaceae bacterium]
MKASRISALWTVTLLALALSGCATGNAPAPLPPPGASSPTGGDHLDFLDAHDPLEPMNRAIYRFNVVVDRHVLEPAVRVYERFLPEYARERISDFFSNLGDVPVLLNCALQAKGERAGTVLARIMVNTVVGVGGLWDVAETQGLPKYNEDFGQTLAVYGVGAGPYLVIPVLGPSTIRDAGGRIVDGATQNFVTGLVGGDAATDLALSVVDGLEFRASMPVGYGGFDSPFEYEMVRTLYLDIRNFLIHDGALPPPEEE